MAPDKKTLHCVVRKYLFCPHLSKFAVPSVETNPLWGFGSDFEMRGSAAAAPRKADINTTRATNVIFHHQQNCALHRWRQPLRHSKDAGLRHRLQAPAEGISKPRNATSSVLLHGDH